MDFTNLLAGAISLAEEEVTSAPTSETTSDAFGEIMEKIATLVNAVWPYLLIACAAIVVVWGVYIGIRIAMAHKNEDQINARGMLKNLIIGVVVIFAIMVLVPLLMNALCDWAGVTGISFGEWFTFA